MTHLTAAHNYFEDFAVGDTYEHTRGKTISEVDGVLLTQLVRNTAQAHYNEARMRDSEFGERIIFGGVTLAIVCGLASEDISENAVTEVGYESVTFPNPVVHDTTVSAESEVLETGPAEDYDDCGEVTFRVRGTDEDGAVVVEATKTIVLKKRAYDGIE